MKKVNKPIPFDFDETKEYLIYQYAADMLNKKSSRKVKMRFLTHEEWKNYVMDKYRYATLDSLLRFKRYLNFRYRYSQSDVTAQGSALIPVVALLIGYYTDMVRNIFESLLKFPTLLITVMIMVVVYKLCIYTISSFGKDSRLYLLYEDYMEIIDELIKEKGESVKKEYQRFMAEK